MNDMVQIKLGVEGMKHEIIKCFDIQSISAGIRAATEKAVSEFDMESYIAGVVADVMCRARDSAIDELQASYGHRLCDEVTVLVDNRLKEVFKETGTGE